MTTRERIIEWWTDVLAGKRSGALVATLQVPLTVLSWVYCVIVTVRNMAYDLFPPLQERVSAEVISIGNITTGGTGKTPAVEWFAKKTQQSGKSVAILSRGYGGKRSHDDVIIVSDDKRSSADFALTGEEPLLLSKNLPGVPVLICGNRVAAAKIAIERFGAQTLILDDGFQYRRLARDRDIVLVDTTRPLGTERLLPRGRLREPLRGLSRATEIILTRCDQGEVIEQQEKFIRRFNARALIAHSVHKPGVIHDVVSGQTRPLDFLQGKGVIAISSIGNPDAFETSLKKAGAHVLFGKRFPDHHQYTPQNVSELLDLLHAHRAELIACSDKDGVKLGLSSFPVGICWSLGVEFQLEDDTALHKSEAINNNVQGSTRSRFD